VKLKLKYCSLLQITDSTPPVLHSTVRICRYKRKKRKSIYIRNVRYNLSPPEVSVFTNKSYVASKPTPATPAEGVIDLFHLHQLLHNPKHHYFQSIGKRMLALRHCIRQNRSGTIWSEAYIIWISRSYRKTCCATVCWRQQMIAFSTCNATLL
jgi:hypothetical protein